MKLYKLSNFVILVKNKQESATFIFYPNQLVLYHVVTNALNPKGW